MYLGRGRHATATTLPPQQHSLLSGGSGDRGHAGSARRMLLQCCDTAVGSVVELLARAVAFLLQCYAIMLSL